MFGKNKISGYVKDFDGSLDIVNIFKTIQGEGPYAGRPAIFIRLSGCNLKCSFCDTEFDVFNKLSLEEILKTINKLANNVIKLIVITGGEPLRQPIEELCEKLINDDFLVQIETNGTLYRKLNPNVKLVCSPKNNNGTGYNSVNQNLFDKIDHFKILISKSDKNYMEIPDNFPKEKIFIQPLDEYSKEKNDDNLRYAINLSITKGIPLSLQQHKIMNIE